MNDIAVQGVLIAPLLVWMAVAFAINVVLRRVLLRAGWYRLVWHRALFDFSLYIVVLGVVVAVAQEWVTS